MSKLPLWARKPNHKKEVIATSRGWMVKSTGEYLKLVKDLDARLKELKDEVEEVVLSVAEPVVEEPITQEKKPTETEAHSDSEVSTNESEVVVEEIKEEKPKKRRGRPSKSKEE